MNREMVEQICLNTDYLNRITWDAPVKIASVQRPEWASFSYLLVADKHSFADEIDAFLVLQLRLLCALQEWDPAELSGGPARITAFNSFLRADLLKAPFARISYEELARKVDLLPELRTRLADGEFNRTMETSEMACTICEWNDIEVFGAADGHYFVLNWYTLS